MVHEGGAFHIVNARTHTHTKLYINKEVRFGISSIFYKNINCFVFLILACCIAGVFGNVIKKRNCNSG